jgi:hypothetical protein
VPGDISRFSLTLALLLDSGVQTGSPAASSSAQAHGLAVGGDVPGAGDGAILGVDGDGARAHSVARDGVADGTEVLDGTEVYQMALTAVIALTAAPTMDFAAVAH